MAIASSELDSLAVTGFPLQVKLKMQRVGVYPAADVDLRLWGDKIIEPQCVERPPSAGIVSDHLYQRAVLVAAYRGERERTGRSLGNREQELAALVVYNNTDYRHQFIV